MTTSPRKVVLTGAAGQIAYSLAFMIAHGDMFGASPVVLHLLDIPGMDAKLRALAMELEDTASPLLLGVACFTAAEEAFRDVDVALLVGASPRGPGMERKDLLAANAGIFRAQGAALNAVASRNVKVLVVGNPANTNCLIAMTHAPDIPRENFTALTRLDQNRAVAAVAKRAGVSARDVSNVIIWGNHSSTQYPDARFATLAAPGGVVGVTSRVEESWLRGAFVSHVQQRGAEVIKARGASSAGSAAAAICAHVRDWLCGSDGRIVSMGVCSDDTPYDVAKGLIFSFPVQCERGGKFRIPRLFLDDFSVAKIRETEAELLAERAMALEAPAPVKSAL